MATFPSKVNYATGDILTATNMNDVGGAINLLQSAQFSAGKNAIINGDFGIWQRGTSFNQTYFNTGATYTADRFNQLWDNTPTAVTVSQQTFTPGTAPVAGYEGTFFLRNTITTVGTCTVWATQQRIEDVRTFAGQTVTLSFWAKADSARNTTIELAQVFGSGGSTLVNITSTTQAVTASWARYTLTVAVPSISGKTIGTSSYLRLNILQVAASGSVLDLWGVQLEAASTASNFQTATGTKQGELAACQRYYWRSTGVEAYGRVAGQGIAQSTTGVIFAPSLPVTMRVYPTSIDYANLCVYDGVTILSSSAVTLQSGAGSLNSTSVNAAVTGAVTYRPYFLAANNNTAGYIGFNAEL
jgi:hypothetical protein